MYSRLYGSYSGYDDYDSEEIAEEDESIREETKQMYAKNKEMKLLRDDMVRHIRKANGIHYQRFEKKIKENIKSEIAEAQTKWDQNVDEKLKTLGDSLGKRIEVLERQVNNVRKTTTVLKDRVPSEVQKRMAENAPKKVFLHKLQNLVTLNEEQQKTVKDIAVEALSHLKCFNVNKVLSTRQVGNKGVDPDKVELKDMKILVQFDSTDVRDEIVEESSQRSATKNSIRPGKTPEEIKKNRMFYNCMKLCEAKNAQLSGEQKETGVYHPVILPGSETLFTPKLRDPRIIQKNRIQYREKMAQRQAIPN